VVQPGVPRDDETRLVYSTGDTSASSKKAKPGPPPPPKGTPRASGGKGVRLRLETRSGRVVTLVLGLVGNEAQLAELARVLRAACSAGGAVREGVIELQGDQREKAQAALLTHGIKAQV
jgi:translation initiation factor 1